VWSDTECVYSAAGSKLHPAIGLVLGNLRRDHGRVTGWLFHFYATILLRFGAYDRFRQLRWQDVRRLVFVCKGNICRSIYCEARAVSLGLPANSRGLEAGIEGSIPSVIVQMASRRGLDLSTHRPRKFIPDELLVGDLIVVMEPAQARQIEPHMRNRDVQVTLLGLWHPRPRPYIQDPFGMQADYVENCMTFMDTATEQLAAILRSNGRVP
jgi:protein-tyrosine phosphatase